MLTALMNELAATILVAIMLLTVSDVVLRIFGTAILGTYELVAMGGLVIVGFALPQTSWKGSHVRVDILLDALSPAVRNVFIICTRIVAIILVALISFYFWRQGIFLYRAGDVSLTLRIPSYPMSFALGFCFLVECIVLLTDIFRLSDRRNE